MDSLTPRRIVEELDHFIIGQKKAKKSVAIALRNRWRRQQLPEDLKDEVLPKNIIMIGPTGEHQEKVLRKARVHAEEKLLDMLLPPTPKYGSLGAQEQPEAESETREKLRAKLNEGLLDDREVEVEVREKQMPFGVISNIGMEDIEINIKEMLGNILPEKPRRKKVKVAEAREILIQDEAARLVDMDAVTKEAIERVEQLGIVFIDEVDKIASRGGGGDHGPDVSREGVQRDMLPIVEGSTVTTKHGPVSTEHILFIAAGAFHTVKPSDLIPELQGRFPIRVELHHLGKDEFVRILTEPHNALTRQYTGLMATEGLDVKFMEDAVDELASIAAEVNDKAENIGARRLHTVMEKLLEDVSFEAPDMPDGEIVVNREYVQDKLSDIVKDEDLSRYIL